MSALLFAISIVLGLGFAYVDSRASFDDTGVLAVGIAATCAVTGFLGPRRPWLWALATGVWIPLHDILKNGGFGSLLALAFAMGGAYAGAAARQAVTARPPPPEKPIA